MPDKKALIERHQTEKRAYQYAYENFRYTDAQRKQMIEFIAQAMKVIRGDASFDSLRMLLPLARTRVVEIDSESYRGGTRFSFDARFLNEWTSIYVLGTSGLDKTSVVEPYHLQIDFSPPMEIDRERLGRLLELKVVHGWTIDGGNLNAPEPPLHGLAAFDGGVFEYSPLQQPSGNYLVKVKLTYLNGDDHNPYTAKQISHLEIRRRYLRPEQIKERNDKRFGHLPSTGQRVPQPGLWLGVVADDALIASMPMKRRICSYGSGTFFGPLWIWSQAVQDRVPVQAWWQWVGPDPHADEIARFFGGTSRS